MRSNRLRDTLLATTIIAGVAVAGSANAQDAAATPPSTSSPAAAPATSVTPPAPAAADSPDSGAIVVTGTMFRRTNSETPSPVTVLSAQRLKDAGITNISDAIRSISADNSGSIPTSFTNGFGAGSSGVALRGLTVNSTLVLVDGLRTANYPLSDDGQRAFVDLNSIPQATVDHIDVVKDGASSTYGADAIAGVVNVIMKQQITGVQGTVEGGISQHKDGGEQRMTRTAGTGDLASKGWNIYASAEYERDSQIYNRDRGFPYNTEDLTSIGGVDLNPGSSVPGTTPNAIVAPTTGATAGNPFSGTGLTTGPWQILNPAGCATGHAVTGSAGTGCEVNEVEKYGEIAPQQTRFGVTVHGAVQVNDTSQAYMMFSYFQNKVVSQTTPASIRAANPVNTLNVVLPALLSDGTLNPNDPFAAAGEDAAIRYQFGDIASGSTYLNHMLRAAAGIHGTFGDGWSYSVDATAAHGWLDITQRGYINIANLISDIEDGSYNFVDPSMNTNAVRNALSPSIHTQATTDEDMVQGSITKDLFQLPGGPLQLGVGGSVRYEAQNDPDANPDNTTLNLNAYTAVGHHTVESAYFEVNAPVLKQLEINASGRFDHYQEGYSHFSPKIGAKFTPIPQLAIRGTFSKGFRAPSFAETNGSVIGYTTATIPCSAALQHGATATDTGCTGGSSYNQSYSIGFNTAANPNLKPELSRSFTGGFVVQPISWLSFTADYYNIKKTRVISGGPLAGEALDDYYSGAALPAGYTVTLDSVDPQFPDAIRRVLYVNSPYANAAALKTDGIDLSAQGKFRITDDIRLTSSIEVTDILHYKFKPGAGEAYQEYVGTQAPYITSSGAGTPKWRGNWQNTIEYGKVSLTGTAYYTSGYKAVAIDQFGLDPATGTVTCANDATYGDGDFNCKVKRFIQVDLVGDYKVTDKFDFYFNVINLLNARAPLNAGNYAATNYNPTYTQQGAIGRFFRVGANFKF